MTDFATEMTVMRLATQFSSHGGTVAEDITALLPRINWTHLLWLGRQHGVLLLLHEALKFSSLAAFCPEPIFAQLRAFHEVNQLRSLARAREICQLQDLFDQHAIPAIPVDSWTAAYCLYGHANWVELAPTIHYLVPVEMQTRTEALLEAALHPTKANPEQLIHVGQTPVILNRGLGKHPAASRLWSHPGTFMLGGRTFRRLTPEHWLLQHVEKNGDHQHDQLLQAWKIAGLTKALRAEMNESLMIEARAFGLEEQLLSAVEDSHHALQRPLPPFLSARFRPQKKAPVDTGTATDDVKSPGFNVPYLSTPPRVMDRMLALADIGPRDVVYDLGCGDGRFVIKAVKDFQARGVGIDLDPVRIAEAEALAAEAGVSERATFVCGDIFEANLTETTVLCLYLMPEFHPRIHEQLRREARPGLRIVSHDYIFPGWPPEKTEIIRVGLSKTSQIYLWKI